MPRNTENERKAVERMTQRIKETKEGFGRQVTGEEARRQAVRIAERSAAERREGTRR